MKHTYRMIWRWTHINHNKFSVSVKSKKYPQRFNRPEIVINDM